MTVLVEGNLGLYNSYIRPQHHQPTWERGRPGISHLLWAACSAAPEDRAWGKGFYPQIFPVNSSLGES